MNYGVETSEQSENNPTTNASSTVASVADNAKAWEDYYNQYNSQVRPLGSCIILFQIILNTS